MRPSQFLTSWKVVPMIAVTLGVNLLMTRVLNRRSWRGPLFVTWITTFDCNAFCGFCTTHKLHKKYPKKMPLERALELADEIADCGVWMVGFTGGEVFLDDHLKTVVQHLKSRGLTVYIVTNGQLLKENAQWIVETGVDFITVSLDTDKPEDHDEIRKVDGLFKAATEGILEIKRLRGTGSPKVNISTVLMKQNLDRMGEVIDGLSKIADEVQIQPITYGLPNSPHGRDEGRMETFRFEEEEKAELRAKLSPAKWSKKFKGAYYDLIECFWLAPDKLAEKVPCWAPFLRLVIYPDGKVLHCMANDRFGSVGNVLNYSLMEAWNSQTMRSHRRIIGSKKNGCICWTRDTSFNAYIMGLPLLNRLPILGGGKEPPQDETED